MVWDFKEEKGNSCGDRKANVWQTDVCWPSLTNAVRIFSKDIDQMGLARSFPVYHTFVHIKQQLLMMIPPFLEQLLDLNSSRQLEGR